MSIRDFNRLTKLTITADETGEVFKAMFNPESYAEKFSVNYKAKGDTNSGVEGYTFIKSIPQDFKLKIFIDGTGVSSYSVPFIPDPLSNSNTVYQYVNTFLKMAWMPNIDNDDKPNLLKIEWGEFKFWGRLKDVNINYSLFDRDGKPLRAELDATFISDTEMNLGYYEDRFDNIISSSALGSSLSSAGKTGTGAAAGASSVTGGGAGSGSSSGQGIVISLS